MSRRAPDRKREPVGEFWSKTLVFVGGLLLLLSIGAFLIQAGLWFFSGNFPEVSLETLGYVAPTTKVWGFNQIFAWLYAQSVVFLAFMLGCGMLLYGEHIEPRRR